MRPSGCCCLLRREGAGSLNELFVVLATSRIRGLDTEVELGGEDGMPRVCVLNADHVNAADKSFLTKRITVLGAEKMSEVCRALARAIGC